MKGLILTLTLLLFSNLSIHASKLKSFQQVIFNGVTLPQDQLPQVQVISHGNSVCTATLIGPKTIISAAHCANALKGYFGVGNQKVKIKSFMTNPKYQGEVGTPEGLSLKYDIAIGILENAIIGIDPITVTNEIPAIDDSILFLGAGWPKVGSRQFGHAKTIVTSSLDVTVRNSEAKQTGASGDSGGPAFYRLENSELQIFGINSTSTRALSLSSTLGPLAQPYTMGIARILADDETDTFLEDVIENQNIEICGINLNCSKVTANFK